jgi:hypothetical protein
MFAVLLVVGVPASWASSEGATGAIGRGEAGQGTIPWIDLFIDETDELWKLLNCSPDGAPPRAPDDRMEALSECADRTPPPKVPDPASLGLIGDSVFRVLDLLNDPANPADPERVSKLRASLYNLLLRLGM